MDSTAEQTGFTLKYRVSFLTAMMLAGLAMTILGAALFVGAIVLFRPGAIFISAFLAIGGVRLLRRYIGAFRRRRTVFEIGPAGIKFTGTPAYEIPWRGVLGLYAAHRAGRAPDLFIYLAQTPDNPLFLGENDPRAAMFSGHRPEAPYQLHLRLSHFHACGAEDIEAALRAAAPRGGALPDEASRLAGHLSAMNWTALLSLLIIVFGGVLLSIMISVSAPSLATTIAGTCVLALLLLTWGGGRLMRRMGNWASPRLIAYKGMLYLPGTALGAVKLQDIMNARYKFGMLTLLFTAKQSAVVDYQSNRYGLFARARILTRGDTRTALKNFFTPLHLWETGKFPDFKAARAKKTRLDRDLNDLVKQPRKKLK